MSFFIFLFLIFAIIFLILKYIKLSKKYKNLNQYLKNYSNIITSARYGNLNLKCEASFNLITEKISQNTNALLESILDRDKMINEYIERENEAQEIKQDFISSLTHDLKVPVIAQDNTYDLFLNDKLGKLDENQKHAIKILKSSNNDLKNLIVNLSDIYRLDKSKLELNLKNIELNSLIKEIIEQNQSILKINEKEIIFNEEEKIIKSVDEFLIKRVLNNLISNAIFYGKNSKKIYINLKKENSNAIIEVIDEGEGIKEEEIKTIFKKYYTSAKKYSNIGVGLGLYIANKIILAHNGALSAQNTLDKGACFKITL